MSHTKSFETQLTLIGLLYEENQVQIHPRLNYQIIKRNIKKIVPQRYTTFIILLVIISIISISFSYIPNAYTNHILLASFLIHNYPSQWGSSSQFSLQYYTQVSI